MTSAAPSDATTGLRRHRGVDQRVAAGPHQRRERERRAQAQRQPQQAARAGNRHRLGQELRDDVAPPRADGAADADLARPLEHRREQHVHDADAADEERDGGERAHQQLEEQDALRRRRGACQPARGHGHAIAVAGARPGIDARAQRGTSSTRGARTVIHGGTGSRDGTMSAADRRVRHHQLQRSAARRRGQHTDDANGAAIGTDLPSHRAVDADFDGCR